jgi:hypothetical protein
MPFGEQVLTSGATADFDLLYQESVRPAVEAAGLTPLRVDTLVAAGSVEQAVVEVLARAEVMIADLSSGNPYVFYELGMRHALAPRTTLLLLADGCVPPNNLVGLPIVSYAVSASPGEPPVGLRDRLTARLRSSTSTAPVDSPFYRRFPVEPPGLPADPLEVQQRRGRAESVRARLLELRTRPPDDAPARVRDLEDDIAAAGLDDDRMRLDLMLTYRDLSAWDDCIRVIEGFPPELAGSATVVQQNALAHNRRGRPGDADRAAAALQELITRIGPDSETYGLLGRIHKDRYQRTGDRAELDAAIDAYRRGRLADPQDLYPGVNLVTLLTRAGGAEAEKEVRTLVPELRGIAGPRATAPSADYWDTATAAELAVLDRDWDAAKRLVDVALSRAVAGWMINSTVNNLQILAEAMPDVHDRRETEDVVRRLAPGGIRS